MSNLKAVFTDYQYENIDQEKKILTDAGIDVYEYQIKDAKQLLDITKDADAIITQYSDINREVIENLEHCKMIIKYGIGVNNIDSNAATEKGIYVCNVPDYGIDEVSNHAIALLMALARKLPTITDALRKGDWGYGSIVPLHRVAGSTLGLIGFGRIPQLVAKKMAGFDVNIIAYDPFFDKQKAADMGVKLVDLDELCKESDYISIHCPLTPETTHIINKDRLSMMKQHAIIINTARGPVICEEDLIEALNSHTIAGAGLDVYEEEPIKIDNKLLSMENVIATPHCAWYTEEAILNLQRKVAEEVANVLQGNLPFNLCNREVLSK